MTLAQDNAKLAATSNRTASAGHNLAAAVRDAVDALRIGDFHTAHRVLQDAAESADRILGPTPDPARGRSVCEITRGRGGVRTVPRG